MAEPPLIFRIVWFPTPNKICPLLVYCSKYASARWDVLLFPEIPYWIATTKQGEKFLRNLTGKKTLLEVSKEILGDDYEIIAKEFLTPLIESKVVRKLGEEYPKKQKIDIHRIKPNKIKQKQTSVNQIASTIADLLKVKTWNYKDSGKSILK